MNLSYKNVDTQCKATSRCELQELVSNIGAELVVGLQLRGKQNPLPGNRGEGDCSGNVF